MIRRNTRIYAEPGDYTTIAEFYSEAMAIHWFESVKAIESIGGDPGLVEELVETLDTIAGNMDNDHPGICPYGCDAPHLAQKMLAQIVKKGRAR